MLQVNTVVVSLTPAIDIYTSCGPQLTISGLSGSKQADGVGPAIVNHADSPGQFEASSTWTGSSIVVTLQTDLRYGNTESFSFNLTNDLGAQAAVTGVSIASVLIIPEGYGGLNFSAAQASGIMQIMQAEWNTASVQQSLPYRTSPHVHPL